MEVANSTQKKFLFMKKKLPTLWTRSRFVSTVGAVSLDVVKQYIQEQKRK
jgi:putative transposase